jgi:hypothetical protein
MKLFTAIGISICMISVFSNPVKAQSMRDLFMLLPDEATPGLNHSDRKKLIKEDEYIIEADNGDDETDYAIDTATDDYLSYEYTISNGKGAINTYEIKKFKIGENKYVLFFTKDGDAINNTEKYVFKAYDITGNSISENYQHFIPDNLNCSFFVKTDAPDSVRAHICQTAYYTFDLDITSPDKVEFRIMLKSQKEEKWLTGNTMVFKWNGNMFINSVMFAKDE